MLEFAKRFWGVGRKLVVMDKPLCEKNVLITGASRGIGRAIAQAIARSGARLAVHCLRNREQAQETVAACEGGPHRIFAADLSVDAEVETLAKEVRAELGSIDVLVNNAGIYEKCPVESGDSVRWRDVWRRTIAVNLTGPAYLSFLVAGGMIESGQGGRIINISSRGAFRGEPDALAYGASKAGLNALGQSMAQALAPRGVFVFTVAPGFVETDMAKDALAGPDGDSIRNQSPFGRVARAEEIADTVLFLAGDAPAFATGSIIDINGASYLRT
jgi:3-oxoacyl-[acyl-carrier protein] reductase